jgi:hypothetical protein
MPSHPANITASRSVCEPIVRVLLNPTNGFAIRTKPAHFLSSAARPSDQNAPTTASAKRAGLERGLARICHTEGYAQFALGFLPDLGSRASCTFFCAGTCGSLFLYAGIGHIVRLK